MIMANTIKRILSVNERLSMRLMTVLDMPRLDKMDPKR